MEIPSFIADFLFPKPKIPALDLAGVVAEVGADVTTFKVGDRVAATQPIVHTRWGTLSEYSAVDASHAALVPESVSLRDAAAVSLVGLTAVQALANVATSPGDTILIHAGSGGLGSFAVQWASKVLGLHVSATVRTTPTHNPNPRQPQALTLSLASLAPRHPRRTRTSSSPSARTSQ
jgi:NADPH:quinone reductase-like Zn-dependent oxidoreductase